ncbi:hypothetical protein D3C87_1829950 [compost metagenome]
MIDLNQLIQIQSGFKTHTMEHVHDIFGRNIARSSRSIRTTAQTTQARIKDRYTLFVSSQNVRKSLSTSIVKMPRQFFNWHNLF